jgi:hypothetical protein
MYVTEFVYKNECISAGDPHLNRAMGFWDLKGLSDHHTFSIFSGYFKPPSLRT